MDLPAVVAMQYPITDTAADIDGGAYVGGGVHSGGGDFVERDLQVGCDLVRGYKVDVRTGNISMCTGHLFIGRFNDVIATLDGSGQADTAEALKLLKAAIMASQEIPEEQKQEQVEAVSQLGEEAVKPKPNRTIVKALADGLLIHAQSRPRRGQRRRRRCRPLAKLSA